uniref:Myeloid cell nuclear differentiation antigen n=1 Tax=Sus scrofa TaxID=9823 RepID=A0A8D1XVF4_PIG
MTNKYKKIILLKGLEKIDEYHFSMIKSLLAHDLELTREMQDNYDRVKIADLMELKFPGITCVNILEELLSDMIKYKDTVKEFRKEKLKVAREIGAEMSPSAKRRKQEETCSDMHGPTTHINLPSEGAKESPVAQKQVNKKNTIYEIQDNTGKMDVLGNGKWHNIECEEGDKLRLFCFQLRTVKKLKLTCGLHSFIQVIKTKKRRTNLIQKVGE